MREVALFIAEFNKLCFVAYVVYLTAIFEIARKSCHDDEEKHFRKHTF